jgi:hypothetical protein
MLRRIGAPHSGIKMLISCLVPDTYRRPMKKIVWFGKTIRYSSVGRHTPMTSPLRNGFGGADDL